jgi:hypothetical protein
MCIPFNDGASGVRAGTRTTAREPLEVHTLRKAPRGWRQRPAHLAWGGVPTTSQGRCNTFVVLLLMSTNSAGAPGDSVGRFATTRAPLLPALNEGAPP